MIKFSKLRFKNILSVGNDMVEFDLSSDSHTLIIGKSGHGKSTIIDALTFGLFGRAYRDIKKNQLVNMINRKKLLVEVEFNQYKIVRGISPNKFEIYCNNELVEQAADVRKYQEYLEKEILKMDYSTFCQIVVLGSAAFTPFMKLKTMERRKVIEELLDLQVFAKMNKDIKGKLNDLKDSFVEIQNDISEKRGKISAFNDMISKKQKVDNTEYETKLKEYRTNIDKLTSKSDIVQEKIKNFNFDENKLNLAKDKLAEFLAEAKHANTTISNVSKNSTCPTCKQEITEEYKTLITEKLNSEIDKHKSNYTKCKKIVDKLNKQSDSLRELTNIYRDVTNKINQTNNQIELIKQKLSLIEEDSDTSDLVNEINKIETDLKPIINKYDRLSKDIENHKKAINLLKDDGIKTVIIEQYIPVLNRLINQYLEKLDMFVSFELDNEFNETVKSRHRDIFTYSSFSIGEQKRLDFSILMAFRDIAKMRNSVASNLLVVDEMLDSLDNDSVDCLEAIINQFSDTQTIFISHSDDLKNRTIFSKVYNTKKSGNFTEYEVV